MLVPLRGAKDRARIWFWLGSTNRHPEVRQLQGGEEVAPLLEGLDVGEQVQCDVSVENDDPDEPLFV